MANWKCDCGNDRGLRSDGIVEACPTCGAPEHDALREAVPVLEDSDFIEGIQEFNQ